MNCNHHIHNHHDHDDYNFHDVIVRDKIYHLNYKEDLMNKEQVITCLSFTPSGN